MQRRLTCFFLKFLYRANALDKFDKNIRYRYKSIDDYVDEYLRHFHKPQALVQAAFDWFGSSEGNTFWRDVSKKWRIEFDCLPESRKRYFTSIPSREVDKYKLTQKEDGLLYYMFD